MSITVYSTPTCPFCKQLKEHLDEKGVEYTNYDVSSNTEKAQEMIEKSGQMGVPVLVAGDETIIGFDKEKVDKVIEKVS